MGLIATSSPFASAWNLRMWPYLGRKVFAEMIKVRMVMRSHGVRVGPKSRERVLPRAEQEHGRLEEMVT